jgi:hypothetical protein
MRDKILRAISNELDLARLKFPIALSSNHEGYAVILEELDELWDAVKKSKSSKANSEMRGECIQIAAMAIRFIEDLWQP